MPSNKPSTAPRKRKPAQPRAATSKSQPAHAAVAAQGPAATSAFEQAPQQLAAMWSQWAEQMQRMGQQALKSFADDAQVEGEAVQRASTPQQWAGLPLGVAAEQVARWAQLSSQMTASLLDVQATLFKDLEVVTTQLLSPWFTHNGRIAFGSAQDLVEPPEQAGPVPMLWSAQRLWSESAKVWLNAMSHDLQSESAAS
ncbi:MAG TPA: hypothetical protein VFK10_04795 [Burkholderiaceae bacterium]|nr:hypothetical protein [Burkholderiaceae bacterium]